MLRKKISCNLCSFLFHGSKLLIAALLTLSMAACNNSLEETELEPSSTFKIHIGESNIVQMDLDAPDYYPPTYQIVLVMENLPADEKIICLGACYSSVNEIPDKSDYTEISNYSNFETIQNWDWSEPLYWTCARLFYLLPDQTYYIRGYVQTNKGEYYSNVMAIHNNVNTPIVENPDAYEIPVVFHLFPDSTGNYPVKEWMIQEELEYANYVYSNSFRIPGQTEAGVHFVAATQAPDGTPLTTPGVVYEKQPIVINMEDSIHLDNQCVWDMEKVLNVWVASFIDQGIDSTSNTISQGFTALPYFDENEKLEGCSIYQPGNFTGIYLNSYGIQNSNCRWIFAHEAGHFLGLYHVFDTEGDFCSDTPWYDRYAYLLSQDFYFNYSRKDFNTGEYFWSDNIMDYYYSFSTGLTPDQVKRIQYTLQHAYFIPGEAGKEEPAGRASGQARHFGMHIVQ